jgi:hypothetical protein
LSEAPEPKPEYGSPAWYAQEAKEMEEAEVQSYLKQEGLRREAEEWGLDWEERPEPISYRSFTRR